MHGLQAAGGAALNAEGETTDAGGTPDAGDAAGGAPATEATPPSRRPLYLVVAALAVTFLAVDQLVKVWAERALGDGRRIEVVGEVFQLRLVYNPGAAFSFATGATGLLTIVAIGVVVFVIWTARRLGSRGWAWALGLLLGGALGNLTDRLLRPPGVGQGHVVDMFALGRLPIIDTFPVFNVADIAITSAACLIIILAIRGIGLDGSRITNEKKQKGTRAPEGPEDE